jgi:biopolymer transport protein ExbB
MATTKQAAPAKKSEGFQGVRGAFWIIVVCAIIAFTLFFTWFGNDMHFQAPGVQDHPADIWGTIYKGGVIVPVIHTLLLTVLAMTIERWLALKTATGTGALPKFVANIKAALNANDFAKAEQLCNKQRGTVANVVMASLNAYKSMESGANASLKKAQKVSYCTALLVEELLSLSEIICVQSCLDVCNELRKSTCTCSGLKSQPTLDCHSQHCEQQCVDNWYDYTTFVDSTPNVCWVILYTWSLEVHVVTEPCEEQCECDDSTYHDDPECASYSLKALRLLSWGCLFCSCHNFTFF